MNNLHVKTGDNVMIISGKDKGKTGKVLQTSPKEGKVIVEGLQKIGPGMPVQATEKGAEAAKPAAAPAAAPVPSAATTTFRVVHHGFDDSVFIDNGYVIRGVAGRLLVYLLRRHLAEGRLEFSNREIRLAPELRLPDFKDNLETRLLLLRQHRGCSHQPQGGTEGRQAPGVGLPP